MTGLVGMNIRLALISKPAMERHTLANRKESPERILPSGPPSKQKPPQKVATYPKTIKIILKRLSSN